MEPTLENVIELLLEVEEDVDFENCTTLIDDNVLNSFDILQIVSTLDDAFDVEIPAKEIVPENFNSAEALLNMVIRLLEDE